MKYGWVNKDGRFYNCKNHVTDGLTILYKNHKNVYDKIKNLFDDDKFLGEDYLVYNSLFKLGYIRIHYNQIEYMSDKSKDALIEFISKYYKKEHHIVIDKINSSEVSKTIFSGNVSDFLEEDPLNEYKMKSLKQLFESTSKITTDGKYLNFPDGAVTSIPIHGSEGIVVVVDNKKGSQCTFSYGNKNIIFCNIDNKWDKEFKNIKELVNWLNKEGFTNYIGIDDVI